MRDRYERLQSAFNKKDREDAAMSGYGGEVTEANELFNQIREAREEQATQQIEPRTVIV